MRTIALVAPLALIASCFRIFPSFESVEEMGSNPVARLRYSEAQVLDSAVGTFGQARGIAIVVVRNPSENWDSIKTHKELVWKRRGFRRDTSIQVYLLPPAPRKQRNNPWLERAARAPTAAAARDTLEQIETEAFTAIVQAAAMMQKAAAPAAAGSELPPDLSRAFTLGCIADHGKPKRRQSCLDIAQEYDVKIRASNFSMTDATYAFRIVRRSAPASLLIGLGLIVLFVGGSVN